MSAPAPTGDPGAEDKVAQPGHEAVCSRCGSDEDVHHGLCQRCRSEHLDEGPKHGDEHTHLPRDPHPAGPHSPPWRRRGA